MLHLKQTQAISDNKKDGRKTVFFSAECKVQNAKCWGSFASKDYIDYSNNNLFSLK